ncbi:MAG: tetratricopeptide repeat protein, partial [Thermoplasmata archaeon]
MRGKEPPAMRDLYKMYESALFFYSNRDFHGAIIQLKEILSLAPEFKEAWELLGNCYKALGDADAAQQCYQQSQKLTFTGALTYSCPFCGTVVGASDNKCKGCGVIIVENVEEKGGYRGFVLARSELKVSGKVEFPEHGERKTDSQIFQDFQQYQTSENLMLSGRESQPPYTFPDFSPDFSVRSSARFGFADINGLTFGRKKICGISPKLYFIPIVFLLFLLISLFSG